MTVTIGDLSFDHAMYDERGDVLYPQAGERREAAESLGTPEGHAVRYDDAGKVIGITIINALAAGS